MCQNLFKISCVDVAINLCFRCLLQNLCIKLDHLTNKISIFNLAHLLLQIALNAPKESITYKNSVNNSGSLFHRFTFNKIFSPASEQEQIFNEMVLPKLKEFLEGRNQLIFTYGATSSGKTFTIQGISEKPGILPRALDSIL